MRWVIIQEVSTGSAEVTSPGIHPVARKPQCSILMGSTAVGRQNGKRRKELKACAQIHQQTNQAAEASIMMLPVNCVWLEAYFTMWYQGLCILVSLGWGYTVSRGPHFLLVWNKFLLSCISQPDKGYMAILVCTVVACIFSATFKPGFHCPLGWAGRHTLRLGDNSCSQSFVGLLQAAHSTGGREDLCYCSYLCSSASPSPSSISDTDLTAVISLALSAGFLSHSLFHSFG